MISSRSQEPDKRPPTVIRVRVSDREDLHRARAQARKIAMAAGLDRLATTEVATAVSEMVRNVLLYAGEGLVVLRRTSRGLKIEISDRGPGIPLDDLAAIEAGTYRSRTGLGRGIMGSKALMDRFDLLTMPGQTQVLMEKWLR